MLPLLSLLLAGSAAAIGSSPAPRPPHESGELLYSTEGNRLRRYDVDTLGEALPAQDVLVERHGGGGESGGGDSTPNGRDINGMICAFPDGSGRFVAGEDTNQPSPPAGWGLFAPDGSQIGKLTPTYPDPAPEPFGCAFAPDGTLFTTSTGIPGIGVGNGQLIQWFGPYEGYPGAPGSYPNDAISANFCKIAVDIGTATGIAIDVLGNVYVSSGGLLQIQKFAPPFPTGLGPGEGCESVDAQGSPLADVVHRSVLVQGALIVSPFSTFTGLAMAQNGNLYAASIFDGSIGEFRLDAPGTSVAETLVRTILPRSPYPQATGSPQGLAVGGDGTLYYADLNLVGDFPDLGPGPNGSVRRIRFDTNGDPLPPETIRSGLAFPDGVAVFPGHLPSKEWRTYAGSPSRSFHNPDEFILGAEHAGQLVQRWRFETGAILTGSPTVARLEVPGEGVKPIAFIQSWDGNVYAVRVEDGSELWRFTTEPQPGANFPNTASAHVEAIDGRETVFIGSGHVFYALDALDGHEIWRFVVGTGCVDAFGVPPGDCVVGGERNEIEASAIVADGKVFFGMDVNDSTGGKGGFFALDAGDGRMSWFFDLESGQTCRPFASDEIRQFDGFHDAERLGLPDDFFATRPGCDFPRSPNGCGNVWSTPSYDPLRRTLYVASSNCDTQVPGGDPLRPAPPMPPFDEAVFAITTDGDPVWRWRPYAVDNDDFAFGGSPNLFTLRPPGHYAIDVVGIGQKDGHYRVLDRSGHNVYNGLKCVMKDADGVPGCGPAPPGEEPALHPDYPYWDTQVVPGGDAGGVLLTASVDETRRRVYFSTAPGFDPLAPQQPTLHALDLDTGEIVWDGSSLPQDQITRSASFAPASTTPELAFFGTVPFDLLRVVAIDDDAPDGLSVYSLSGFPISGAASGAVVVDGTVLVGHGLGVRGNPQDPGTITSNINSALVALCAPGTAGCAACDDGLDNDYDGLVDGDDDGCAGPADRSERPDCSDALDNDHDGLDDYPADPACASPDGPSERETPAGGASLACGLLGPEPLLAFGLVSVLRRGLRHRRARRS